MDDTTASHVYDLHNDNFRAFIQNHDYVAVGFVLPWLKSYERFSREFEEAAQMMHGTGVQFAKVDCTKETELWKMFKFSRWPTINLFRGLDNYNTYEGSWRTTEIVSYLRRQLLPTMSVITADSLQDFKGATSVVVVGCLAPDDDISREAFKSVAQAMHEQYVFGLSDDDTLAKAEHINIPSVILYKDFDEGKNVFELTHDSQAIASFVKAHATPLVVDFLPEVHASYMKAGLPLGYIFAETDELPALLSTAVQPVAQKYKGKIQFGTVDVKIFESLADDLHLELNEWPAFAVREPIRNHRYPLNLRQLLSHQKLDTFIRDFLDGKLAPTIKSEPVPEIQQGPVTVVVGYTYDDLVINNDKDVLIEYYTQWCGPCKTLAPTYEKLAELYAANSASRDRITIAKIDAEANDVPGDIRGFPTVQIFSAGSKKSPVDYDGPWTLKDMADFVRDNGRHKVDVNPDTDTKGQI